MKINIYYGGRGLVDDPTIFTIEKMTKVFEELQVDVERYNLYEQKNNITVLPKTLKDVDGIILAASVEWFGVGGYLQQFLDACWLYGDKEKISQIYMFPVVMATTYGEREAEYSLIRAWEMLGGVPSEGLCAYVEDHVEFETNAEYNLLIEKKAENMYRKISKNAISFPSSSMQVKKTVLKRNSLQLTPQESEQLSQYVSDDNFVNKQKEDIEQLATMFKGMMGEKKQNTDYVTKLIENFYPQDNFNATFLIDIIDEESSLVIEIHDDKLACRMGTADNVDVTAKVKSNIFSQIVEGERTFQSAFMSGELSAQGNFKVLRNFDSVFRFQ